MREVFLGGLPREPRRLKAVELGLHAALLSFSRSSDPSSVRLRLHTRSGGGGGLGFGFAWLPDEESASSLVAQREIWYSCEGERLRAGVRAARGSADARPPPSSEPAQLELRLALVGGEGEEVHEGFEKWRRHLRRFGLGLEVREVLASETGSHSLEKVNADLLLLLYRKGQLAPAEVCSLAARVKARADAGGAVLVVDGPVCDTNVRQSAKSFADVLAEVHAADVAKGAGGCRVDVWGAHELEAWSYPLAEACAPSLYGLHNGGNEKAVQSSWGCSSLLTRPPASASSVDRNGLDVRRPSPPSWVELVSGLAVRRAVACHLSSSLKVFVSDCDGTLWDGVLSEDGVDGIQFGQAHLELQAALSRLQQAGRLVCLASKNNVSDVVEVFSRRADEMRLAIGQITSLEVHWDPKPSSIRRISECLALPLHSFVFIDDSPAEINRMRESLPDVLCIGLPGGRPDKMRYVIHHHWALDVWRSSPSTAEDNLRTQTYQQNEQRRAARRAARHLSLSAFLKELQMHVDIREPLAGDELERVAQLTCRTNQMNATLLRFRSELEIQLWKNSAADLEEPQRPNGAAELPRRFALAAWVSDSFGQYGLVACALCRIQCVSGQSDGHEAGDEEKLTSPVLVVESLNMSCRVLGRAVEIRILKRVGAEARLRGASRVALPFIPSLGERKGNRLMQRFLSRLKEVCARQASCAPALSRGAPCAESGTKPVSYTSQQLAGRTPSTLNRLREPGLEEMMLLIGAYCGRRGELAKATLIASSTLESLDVAAWLDETEREEGGETESVTKMEIGCGRRTSISNGEESFCSEASAEGTVEDLTCSIDDEDRPPMHSAASSEVTGASRGGVESGPTTTGNALAGCAGVAWEDFLTEIAFGLGGTVDSPSEAAESSFTAERAHPFSI